ncbi:type II secretion system protein J [Nocardioides sp. NPDC057577]|uniref:type II secretion system protein J n=1 Tax=Nocardioides sp. NPDC057577 TaxID=3346171 RepID=UPI00366D961B
MNVPWRSDRGETLVEVLVAVSILGIAGVAVVTGLQMSITSSDIHRKQTTGGAYARSYAESIQDYVASAADRYVPCAGANAYSPATVGFTVPSGYTAEQAVAKRVPPDGGVAGACSGNDTGVQQIEITLAASDGRAAERLTVLLRRPCGPTMAVCG